jgi:hypothetical protein
MLTGYTKMIFIGYNNLNCSPSGNPRREIFLKNKDGSTFMGKTKTDADCAYGVGNFKPGKPCYIKYRITKKGNHIIDYMFTEEEFKELNRR